MKHFVLLTIFIVFYGSVFSQKNRKDYIYEFLATSENDNYALTFLDGYYTNGLFLQFNKPASWKTNSKLQKIIGSLRLGQMIFNSENYDDATPQRIDRPLSGYLFLQKGYKFFFRKGHLLQTDLAIGGTGKSSLAKEIQTGFHKLADLPDVKGWPFQLNGEASLNLAVQYNYNLLGTKNEENSFEMMGVVTGNFGNAFTNTSGGLMMKFGNFEDPLLSSFYNARLGRGSAEKLKRKAEIFIYFYPQLMHQFYNATVQGPLFRKDKGPIVSDITKQYYMHKIGFHYAERFWTFDMNYVMKNREAESMRHKEKYVSLTLGYRFGRSK